MLYRANVETSNYRFHAYGTTEQEARGVLALTWNTHAEQTGAVLSWEELEPDVYVEEIAPGYGYRDGSDIVTADTASSASRQTFIDTGAHLPIGVAGTESETWNTSPAESPDLACVLDPSDFAALMAGRPVHLEGWSPDDPHGMPAAIVRVTYDPHA